MLRMRSLLSTGPQVWQFLTKRAGLDVEGYDRDIADGIRVALSLPLTGTIHKLILHAKVDAQAVITAFFEASGSYRDMLNDLLLAFEKAGAKSGPESLPLVFRFDNIGGSFDFTPEHFRAWLEEWEIVTKTVRTLQWDSHSLWQLNGIFRQGTDVLSRANEISDQRVRSWVAEYRKGRWPEVLPPPPSSGVAKLDELINQAWQVLGAYVSECRRISRDREGLGRYATWTNQPLADRSKSLSICKSSELAGLDSDLWPASLAIGATLRCAAIKSESDQALRSRVAGSLASELREAFGARPSKEQLQKELVRHLIEFLNLPIWKKRHELFASWVFAQIIDAIAPTPVVIHHVDGRLRFAFAATHLATIEGVAPRVQIWAELRSPLDKPKGKGRKGGIQPDYTLMIEPITDAASPILVVECKQYKRASRRNFCDAIDDYARARPSAQIALVNYGPGIENFKRDLDASIQGRTHLIPKLQPKSETLTQFRHLVRMSIDSRCRPVALPIRSDQDANFAAVAKIATISLFWSEKPSDLDLYLEIDSPGGKTVIGFNNPKAGPPLFASYAEDVRTGYGPETIEFALVYEATYKCFIHCYSTDGRLGTSDALVKLVIGNLGFEIKCPRVDQGAYWHAFTLDAKASVLKIPNVVSDSP